MDIDITQYNITDLPLVAIKEPEEDTDEEMTSQRSLMSLTTRLRVYFVYWGEDPSSTYKTLIRGIRNKIGASFTLSNNVTEARVSEMTAVLGTLPVYYVELELEMKYYLNEKST